MAKKALRYSFVLKRWKLVWRNVCVCVCGCLAERKKRSGSVCVVCHRASASVCVCSALRGGRLRLSQREVGRLAIR